MKVGIMQPYFLPYIGYFHLIQNVDLFIIYDEIQYTKKGWVNRNQYLSNGRAKTFTIPVEKSSHLSLINQKRISDTFDRGKLLRKITDAYSRAPFYNQLSQVIENIFFFENQNLFDFIFYSLRAICDQLKIDTRIAVSSDVAQISNLTGQSRVIELCERVGASQYVNLSGGIGLYNNLAFKKKNISLSFIKHSSFRYRQFDFPFVDNLSIIDVLMFNSITAIREQLLTNNKIYGDLL